MMTRNELKEKRRQEILMKALELFVERGYYDTKIFDIAEAVQMSTGLMFHYFKSKEELLLELVKMGAEGTKSPGKSEEAQKAPPEIFLEKFLEQLFSYAKESPWVFNMFVLMGQSRRNGMPEEARKIALSVDTVESTAELIRRGQESGAFKNGDAHLLSRCFWASVQGVMEEMAMDRTMAAPDPGWIMSILLK